MRNLPDYFAGDWTIVRTVSVGSTGAAYASGQGTASFHALDSSAMRLEERGTMRMEAAGVSFSFFKTFDYRFTGSGLDIHFADGPSAGSLYQQYDLDTAGDRLLPRQTHLCAQDRYDGQFELGAGRFVHTVHINGPSKDLRIVTVFSRWPGNADSLQELS